MQEEALARTEETGRLGRRRKQLLDNLKENSGYWQLKEEALDRALQRTHCGRGYGPFGKLHGPLSEGCHRTHTTDLHVMT